MRDIGDRFQHSAFVQPASTILLPRDLERYLLESVAIRVKYIHCTHEWQFSIAINFIGNPSVTVMRVRILSQNPATVMGFVRSALQKLKKKLKTKPQQRDEIDEISVDWGTRHYPCRVSKVISDVLHDRLFMRNDIELQSDVIPSHGNTGIGLISSIAEAYNLRVVDVYNNSAFSKLMVDTDQGAAAQCLPQPRLVCTILSGLTVIKGPVEVGSSDPSHHLQ